MNYYKLTYAGPDKYILGDTLSITPEWLSDFMENTARPEGYYEGRVTIELPLSDVASLFGGVSLTAVSKEEWHENVGNV